MMKSAFHMHALAEESRSGVEFPPKEVVMLDPIVAAAWLDPQSFDCTDWAVAHPEIRENGLQLAAAFCVDSHWIPVLLTPWGENVRIASFDASDELHPTIAGVFTRVVHALGFTEIHFDHIPRHFAVKSVCGAVAINFLRSQVISRPRLGSNFAAWEEHHCLRNRFIAHVNRHFEVPRPWLWGSGASSDEDSPRCEGVPVQIPWEPAQSVTARSEHLSSGETPVGQGFDPVVQELLCFSVCQLRDRGSPVLLSFQEFVQCRASLISVGGRVRLLQSQFGVWTDDEIRFHLHDLASRCVLRQGDTVIQRVRVLDPLLASSWIHPGNNISAEVVRMFQHTVADQSFIITVVCHQSHWIPIMLVPGGQRVQIVSGDYSCGIPAWLVNKLTDFVFAIGFRNVCFDHVEREFPCRSACGAVSINFLGFRLGLNSLATKYAAVWEAHAGLRASFENALRHVSVVSRPWIWGAGDEEGSEHSWPSQDPPPLEGVDVSDPSAPSGVFEFQTPDGVATHVCITPDQRIDLFAAHGCSMGDDEVRFHLNTLLNKRAATASASDVFKPEVFLFDCLNFLNWDHVGHILTEKWCVNHPRVKSHSAQIVAVVLEGDHWLPIWAVPAGRVIVFHTFDDVVDYDIFDGKLRWMGLHLGFEDTVIHRVPHGLPSHNFCGVHALAFLAHILIAVELPEEVRTLDFMATNMRAAFVQVMFERRICICPLVWGAGGTGALVKSLAEELGVHGVPVSQAEQRASQAMKAIGADQIGQAMQQKQPWRQLKALATNVGFKLVLPSELATVVAQNKGKQIGRKQQRSKPVSGVPAPLALDPSKLCVLDGTFRSGQKILPQLVSQQIGPVSSGFVLMTALEAEPYLKTGSLVSQEPLALVVFHRSDQSLQSMLAQSRVMVPCRCTVDNEPVLAEATLVQIGNGTVEKFAGSNLVSLDSPDGRTLRINVFRDEVEDWEVFCKTPVRHLVQLFPELKRCNVQGCTCPSWHNEEMLSIKEPILDLWKRQFVKAGFKPAEQSSAELFCVSVRIPACLLVRILSRSGTGGAYVEPRSADGQSVLKDFMVVWAPKMSHRDLMHLKQTNPAVVGLARIGERRGLRVPADQAQDVHQAVRPDTLFLPQGDRVQYIVGPFPFGLDRLGINKAMKVANWQCRPLQPATPQPGRGAMWIVQAVEEPPQCNCAH